MTFYYKNNRSQQLRGFYHTAILGHVTKSATLMNLTQPSISLQIKSLERDLACKLFHCIGPKAILTAEGTALLELIRPNVQDFMEGISSYT